MVTKLLEGLENKGHIIFFDNYYSSIKLFEALTEANFGVTGTWNKGRRSFPAAIRKKNTKKGDIITFVKNNLMIAIWHDKKPVHIMSNIFGSNLIDFENRRGKQMKKPEAILEYNKCKHGVDKVDQMLAYSSFNRRCYKSWQKILFYLHDTTINNISILYYAANPEVKSNSKNLDLRLSIINEFRSVLSLSQKSVRRHLVNKDPDGKSKECAECQKRRLTEINVIKNVTRTIYICETCRIHLCPDSCFKIYHNNMN